MADFWLSSGFHLTRRNENGWLQVTSDYLRAYLNRPEIRPIETSCEEERRLHKDLMEKPEQTVRQERLDGLQDQDGASNYRLFLRLRDFLLSVGTIEGAYLRLHRTNEVDLPPIFHDQMVHIILRNMLEGCPDPIRVRAAEVFFREQSVNTDDGRVMLADAQIVDLVAEHQQSQGAVSLLELAAESDGRSKQITLDVLNEDNKDQYWQRSDQFDHVVDLRYTQPALDAFARLVEQWLQHLLRLKAKVTPLQAIDDDHWRWHIGLDREATKILNKLYQGESLSENQARQIIALFEMTILDQDQVEPDLRNVPIYLALAMSEDQLIRMKPQNLLTNLPLLAHS